MNYLKIENVGVCPPEGFTVFGVSLADQCNDPRIIGKFGSGCKHSVGVLLRFGLAPIVFSGNLKMTFGTQSKKVESRGISKDFAQVVVKYSGKDENGNTRNSSEELGFATDFGKNDWDHPAYALREFVSNAIDSEIALNGNWNSIRVELVEENQVRAKAGCTRVFVPVSPAVLNFFQNLDKWFLHFKSPELLSVPVFPRTNRNLFDGQNAMIYRRGVMVRQFQNGKYPSLFDYNLNDLELDECRVASDWDVRYAASMELSKSTDPEIIKIFLGSLSGQFWEHEFTDSAYGNSEARSIWKNMFEKYFGTQSVITSDRHYAEKLEKKGYNPVLVSEILYNYLKKNEISSDLSILDVNELAGREIVETPAEFKEVCSSVWELLSSFGLTRNKSEPPVICFESPMNGGTETQGFYQDNSIYLNRSILGSGELVHSVVLEELVHYITNSTDNSRDFQNYILNLCAKMMIERK